MLNHASWWHVRAGRDNTQCFRAVQRKRLVLCTAAALMITCGYYAAPSYAQNITGSLHGTAPQGATIEVTAPSMGFSKTLVVDGKGQYDLSQLNPGTYVIKVSKDGSEIGSVSVQVKPNITATVPGVGAGAAAAASAEHATALGTITVSASSLLTITTPIDVTTPELINNYSAELTHNLPINQNNLYSVYALQSSAKSFGGYYQVNGASVSENRTYFNEFDTNYDVTGLSGLRFPQDAVADTQLINGSGGLAWTSTTGGIISATLKQGSNDFHAGYTAIFTPPTSSWLNSRGDNATYLSPSGKQTYSLYQSANHSGSYLTQDVWASGAIIKDKLFFFALLGNSPSLSKSWTYGSNTASAYSSRDKNAMVNLTWNITTNQSLNVAAAKDWAGSSTNQYQLAQGYQPSSISGAPVWSGDAHRQKILIGNYHWRITDDLTFRVMGGYTRLDVPSFDASGPNVPYVTVYDYNTNNTSYYGPSSYNAPNNYYYARHGYKADLNWTLGDHTLTFGGDRYMNNFHFVPYWRPDWSITLNDPSSTLQNGSPVPPGGNYAEFWKGYFGGNFRSLQSGAYLYDTWKVIDNVVLSGGVRWDHNVSELASGGPFLNLYKLSPRIGAAWDVRGDSSLKLGFNYGVYTLPMPSGLNYFVGGANYISGTYYTYTGLDPTTHAPLGLTQVGNPVVYENGAVPNPVTLSSRNLKNTSQRNFQLYVQQQLTPSWSFLGQFDMNHLDNIVDFISDSAGQLTNYVHAHGYPNYAGLGTGGMLFNPGRDIVLTDYLGGGNQLASIVIPNSYLGVPKAKRTSYDLNFQLEHAKSEQEPYYLAVNYTWSHIYGNEDGYSSESRVIYGDATSSSVLQTAGRSGNFNYPQEIPGSSGPLASDTRHKLVVSGIYFWPSGFRVSSLLTARTGTPYGCFGTYPNATAVQNNSSLASVTHYCNGVLVPMNGLGRYPFSWQWDLGVGYNWAMAGGHSLDLALNFTNVTNRQTVRTRYVSADTGNFGSNGLPTPDPSFLTVTALQAPRTTNLVVRYTF
ncbi:TonB-dependent receptor [Dyella flagellata]|uniref:Oar protein n=1 Tax=Dyella flagellata TaxID=1867833 RepID=A0ABQ5XAD8_9GAMM|nr:TonB-dependent receptor [Dyella flagellata]GLQ88604.1 Oar protein [Dyella flagellata]